MILLEELVFLAQEYAGKTICGLPKKLLNNSDFVANVRNTLDKTTTDLYKQREIQSFAKVGERALECRLQV